MQESYDKWYSPNLSKDIEMLVYGSRGHFFLFSGALSRK